MFTTRRRDESKWMGLEAVPATRTYTPTRHDETPMKIGRRKMLQMRPKSVEKVMCHRTGAFLSTQMQVEERRVGLAPIRKTTAGPVVMKKIEAYLDAELRLVTGEESSYQRLNIFREVLKLFSGASKVYSPFVEMVIREYERFIVSLDEKIKKTGSGGREISKKFDDELHQQKVLMQQEISKHEAAFEAERTTLSAREESSLQEINRLISENDKMQSDITRLHEQNLTLSSNIVDLRYQNQTMERELKEAETLERNYRKLQSEHQALLESLAPAEVKEK